MGEKEKVFGCRRKKGENHRYAGGEKRKHVGVVTNKKREDMINSGVGERKKKYWGERISKCK